MTNQAPQNNDTPKDTFDIVREHALQADIIKSINVSLLNSNCITMQLAAKFEVISDLYLEQLDDLSEYLEKTSQE